MSTHKAKPGGGINAARARLMQALRPGDVEAQQLEARGIPTGLLSTLIAEGLAVASCQDKRQGNTYRLTAAGRAACPPRRRTTNQIQETEHAA